MVVSELLLLPALNSLRQETHFRNANGSYNVGTSFALSWPFTKALRLNYRSDLSFNRAISFVEGKAGFNRALSLGQYAGLSLNTQKAALTGSISYSRAANAYHLTTITQTVINTWDFQADGRLTLSPQWVSRLNGSYRINRGYTVAINNPVSISAYSELSFTKRRELNIRLDVYDLLDQQQSVYQSINGNIKSQQTLNRIGRYFMLSVNFNLSRFGDRQ